MNAFVRCSICGIDAPKEDVKHLALYVIGSEGAMACMECRQTLTDVARGIMRTAGKCRMAGYRACKNVHTANKGTRLMAVAAPNKPTCRKPVE